MTRNEWMLYGATGVTGQLILAEALRLGHQPVLAGRSAEKVRALAERHGLRWLAFGLDDAALFQSALGSLGLLLNAAGPFEATSPACMAACVQAGVNYLDIANEISVFQAAASHQREAAARRIVLMPGVGFGVTVSDAIAHHVAAQVPGAAELEIALFPHNALSTPGASRTGLEVMAHGGRVLRGGKLVAWTLGAGARRQRTPEGEHTILPAPLGDLVAAGASTGIPNVTTLLAFPMSAIQARLVLPVLSRVVALKAVRERLTRTGAPARQADAAAGGTRAAPARRHSYAWAKAADRSGHTAEGWLEVGEGYAFTAAAAVRAVEQALQNRPAGVATPAQAFGPDFIQTIDGARFFQMDQPTA